VEKLEKRAKISAMSGMNAVRERAVEPNLSLELQEELP